MKLKKMLCSIIALAMVLSTIGVPVFAADALPGAEESLITLTEDVILSSTLTLSEDVTIDLAGYKITSSDISGSEKAFTPLIRVDGASVTIKDSGETKGTVVPGIKGDVSSYNSTTVTIEVRNGELTVDGAVIEGQKAVNTKNGGIAIVSYSSDVNIVNGSVVFGGDSDKKDISSESELNFKYQGVAGDAIESYGSNIIISDSEVNGGDGTISGTTPVQYLSGLTLAQGGLAIELRSGTGNNSGVASTLMATNSTFNGGDSALYNPEDALSIQGSTTANLDGCTVTGGSVTVGLSNYGIGGDGLLLSGTPTVTVKNSTITAGKGRSSTKNGALEISSSSANPTVTVENSNLVGGDHYAIGGSGKLGSFTLIDTTIKSSGDLIETGTISYITVEGTLTVASDSEAKEIGIEVRSTTGAQIIGASDITEVTVPVAEVDGTYYDDIQSALKAIKENSVFNLLTDVTVDYDWDRRYTGATITVPATINGNENTIKFTGKISEGQNYHSAFRTEADVVFENLTVDMSEATSANDTRMRAISSKLGVTIENCTFIGNSKYTNTRAVIYGEGAGTAISDVVVNITDSTFTDWKRGLSDNEGGKDAKNVTVSGNTFTNADVYVSAHETATFTNNTLDNSWADIRSYTTDNKLNVVATGNTLAENTETKQNFIKAGGTVEAQQGFMLPPPPSLPTATVSEPLINTTVMARTYDGSLGNVSVETPLTFQMNFKADEPTDKQREYYSEWLADYELVINKDVRGIDGYLAGQYDSFFADWIKLGVDTEDVVLKANEPIKVVKDLMGLDLEYEADILDWVKDFDCGIYLTPQFIEANPDLEITLALKLYNPENPEESYTIGEAYEFTAEDAMPQAKIGDTTYQTLSEAFLAAQDGDTVTVLKDFALDEMIVNTKKITLNLNGKTITGTDTTSKNFSLIDNRGELTVTGNGKMTLTSTVNSGWNRYSAVLANNPGGKLVIENGTFEHLGGTDMAYGIDNLTNGKSTYAETIINGGTIKSTYRGIRQFLNGVEAQNILTINGGTVEGANKSIWMQDPSKNANSGTLTVTEKATLNGDVYLFVTEGSTEWPVEVSIAAAALKDGATVVAGNVPDGYEVVESNGVWSVQEKQPEETISWNSTTAVLRNMAKISIAGLNDRYGRIRIFGGIDDPTKYDKYGFKYTITKGDKTLDGEIVLDIAFSGKVRVDNTDLVGETFGNGNTHIMDTSLCFAPEWVSPSTKIKITPFVEYNGTEYYGTPYENGDKSLFN